MPRSGLSAPSPVARARVRGVGRRQRALLADRQERVQLAPRRARCGQAGLGQVARADLAAAEQGPDVGDGAVGERERLEHLASAPPPARPGRAAGRPRAGAPRPGPPRGVMGARGDVLAHHVLERDHLRGRAHGAGVDLRQLADRLQDPAQLRDEPVDLLIGQAQAGQAGDVLDVGSADHGPMIAGARSRRAALSAVRAGDASSVSVVWERQLIRRGPDVLQARLDHRLCILRRLTEPQAWGGCWMAWTPSEQPMPPGAARGRRPGEIRFQGISQ